MNCRLKSILGTALALAVVAGAVWGAVTLIKQPGKKTSLKIGVTVYKEDDTFISCILRSLMQQVKEYEQTTGVKVHLDISDAAESQRLQNEQVKRYISLDYDVLLVNLVDRTNAASIVDAVAEADMPVVFFNREPVEEDLLRSTKLYYVGSDAKESAVLQGEILAEAWAAEPETIDKNQNGVMDYLLLEGELGHQDAIIRTKWVVQTLADLQVPAQKLDSGVADWSRSQAAALMEQWLSLYPGEIEVVIANNDDMALGALDALKKQNITNVQVVGIDATDAGVQAVSSGWMLGTVDCDSDSYADALLGMATALAKGEELPQNLVLEQQRYVRIQLQKFVG